MMTSPASDAEDARYMRRALFLARQGRTHPNPMVGAVVVRDGVIVGEGFHRGVGTPHAEAAAFAAAGDAAIGATLYVTLEPCSFTRTPAGAPRTPCSARCLTAGVARVVGAMQDPDARVAGDGFRQLAAAGVAVTVGVEEDRARTLNAAFVRHRTVGLPYITHKAALTLDGKIAAVGGDSRWVTGPEARAYVHRLRDRADALIVGVGTVLADDPALTTRFAHEGVGNGRDPLRVVVDSTLRTPVGARVAGPGTLIVGAEGRADGSRFEALAATGADIALVAADGAGRVDVAAVARLLSGRGHLNLLLESGGTLAASFWTGGLVSKALFFVAPKIVGGDAAPTPVGGAGGRLMADAVELGKLTVRRFGRDIALETEG
jgi:diaminohydroxyphosphoribosylaminopyrimidine deaminase/5-amino-6-(5-phosphoribosylamino)uracil reductase